MTPCALLVTAYLFQFFVLILLTSSSQLRGLHHRLSCRSYYGCPASLRTRQRKRGVFPSRATLSATTEPPPSESTTREKGVVVGVFFDCDGVLVDTEVGGLYKLQANYIFFLLILITVVSSLVYQ